MRRPSAGRREMGDAVQALCFLAGANSIFYGDKLLTTGNPDTQADIDLLERLPAPPAALTRASKSPTRSARLNSSSWIPQGYADLLAVTKTRRTCRSGSTPSAFTATPSSP